MASNPEFLAVLKAVDEVTGPINAITSKLKGLGKSVQSDFANPWKQAMGHASSGSSGLGGIKGHLQGLGTVLKATFGAGSSEVAEGAHKVGGEIKKVGHDAHQAAGEIKKSAHPAVYDALAGHVKLLRGHFSNLGGSIGEVGRGVTEFLPMLGALAGAGSLTGLADMVVRTAESQGQFEATAKTIGISTRALLGFNLAAEKTDVPVATMQRGLMRLNERVGQVAGGANKQAAALFQKLGISIKDSTGHTKPLTALLPQLADAFKHTHDQAMRSRMAMVLFGRAGIDLLPLLEDGAQGIADFQRQSKKLDYDPTKKERAGLRQFKDSWIDLRHAVDSLQTAIGAKLGPVLRPIVHSFTNWVTKNRDWIATKIVDSVKGLAAALKTMNIKAIVEDFGRFAKHAVSIAGAIGPLPVAIGAVTLGLGAPLLHAIMGAVNDLRVLVTWALKAAKAIGSTLVDSLKSAGTAMKGMDAAFHATTIGRAASLAFEIYDLVHGGRNVNLSGKQKTLLDSWHLKPGQALTSAQRAQLGPLSTGKPHNLLGGLLGSGGGDAGGPSLASPYAGAAPAGGKIESHIYFHGAPPGTRVTTNASGAVAPPRVSMDYLSIGHASPLGYGY